MELSKKRCIPCEAGTPPLVRSGVEKYLKEVSSWQTDDHKKIKKEFKFKNFKESINFINKVAEIAESEGHHPDIYIFYNLVRLELWTHAAQGLTENDFILASKINGLIQL